MASKREALSTSLDTLVGNKKKVEDNSKIAQFSEVLTGRKEGTSILLDEGLRNAIRHYCLDEKISLSAFTEKLLLEFWEKNIKGK